MGHVRDWLTHHDGTRTGALRTVAGAVCGVDAVVVALAPSLSPPVADQWLLHLGFAVALVLEGVLVLVTRRASDEWGVLAAVTLPTVTLLALLACTHQVGTLAALLLWPALATPLFPRRATVWAHLALLATGLAGVVLLAPDPRVSWFTWVAVMAAAISCAVTVRVIAEHDVAEHRQRLERELADARDLLTHSQQLLAKPGFVDKAPPSVVANEKAKLAEREERVRLLEEELRR